VKDRSAALADLPPTWRNVPLKSVAHFAVSNVDKHSFENEEPVRLCNYTDVYKFERITLDMGLMRATATREEISRFHLEVGDVVITKDSESWDDIAVPALIGETAEDLVCGYHLAMIRSNPEALNGRFLFRAIQSRPVALQLELASTGVTRYGLPKGAIGSAKIPLPPQDTQIKIADFLDRETARIDSLVAEKERMLALLGEKRAALISRAVTRGLNPKAPTKSSGLDWLGDIPEHWEMMRVKFLIEELTQGSSPVASNCPAEEGELGILKLSAISRGQFRRNENKALRQSDDEIHADSLKSGDVLVTRSNTPFRVGDACVVPNDELGLLIPDLVYRLRMKLSTILPEFFVAFLITGFARAQIISDARGSSGTMVKISQDHVCNWRIPVPPLQEQFTIVEDLKEATEHFVRVSKDISRSIKLLKERRSALITAAVTGKLDPDGMNP